MPGFNDWVVAATGAAGNLDQAQIAGQHDIFSGFRPSCGRQRRGGTCP